MATASEDIQAVYGDLLKGPVKPLDAKDLEIMKGLAKHATLDVEPGSSPVALATPAVAGAEKGHGIA